MKGQMARFIKPTFLQLPVSYEPHRSTVVRSTFDDVGGDSHFACWALQP